MKSDAPFDKFDSVKVDGQTVEKSNYTAESGSTLIKLLPEYLETLTAGKHTIEIISIDGSAATMFTIVLPNGGVSPNPDLPKTGDVDRHTTSYVIALIVSGVALAGITLYDRKRKKQA